jgi:hypothetical protein
MYPSIVIAIPSFRISHQLLNVNLPDGYRIELIDRSGK